MEEEEAVVDMILHLDVMIANAIRLENPHRLSSLQRYAEGEELLSSKGRVPTGVVHSQKS